MAESRESVRETNVFSTDKSRKVVNDALISRGLPSVDDEERLNEEEEEEIVTGNQVDVFDFCHPRVMNGDVIGYTIYKDNQFSATKPHPYSWEKLQREFGEGHYRVVAKSENTKRILKQQTSFVGPIQEKEEKIPQATVADQVKAALPPPIDPMDQFAKFATVMQSLAPRQAPPPEDKSGVMMVELMKTVMEINKSSQESTNRLIEKMQDNTTKMIERLDASQKDMMGKLEAKIAATAAPKEKGIDSLTLLTLMQGAEKRGMDTWLKLDEMAERKAARLTGGAKDEDEKESSTEKLIRTVLPAVTAALAKPAAPAPEQLPVSGAPIQRPRPMPRPGAPAVPNPPMAPQPGARAAQPNAPGAPGQTITVSTPTKAQTLERLMPIIGAKLLASKAVEGDKEKVADLQREAAAEVKLEMAKVGLTVPALLQMIPQGDIIDIATANNLPVEAHHWLKGFYANLTKLGATGANPQPVGNAATPQPKPLNP